MNWHEFLMYLYSNRVAIGGGFMLALTAAIKTAPIPGTPWNLTTLYAWAYDWFHQTFNITNPRVITPPK